MWWSYVVRAQPSSEYSTNRITMNQQPNPYGNYGPSGPGSVPPTYGHHTPNLGQPTPSVPPAYGPPHPQGSPYPSNNPTTLAGRPAGAWMRFLAYVLDTVFIGLAQFPLDSIFPKFAPTGDFPDRLERVQSLREFGEVLSGAVSISNVVMSQVVAVALWLVYRTLMEHHFGASLGKMFANLRVFTQNYQRPSYGQALKRNAWFAATLPLLIFLQISGPLTGMAIVGAVGFVIQIALGINIAASPYRRHVCDSWADSSVINK
ncbi:hypothetical protein DLJ54_04695 [Corynebacterium heidelbergense]|uniref:RDD domain-containing protein n=2 Tax=Corynebacterium heidelbergense TaxID=2055947 RepID=A0A364V681_9CORY|nr:hypothetical protein DLJ54_04695 [Corynebacterium heidelbergense]